MIADDRPRAWNSTLPPRSLPMPRSGWDRSVSGGGSLGRRARESGGRVVPMRSRPAATGPSRAVREMVLERDGYACVCCGASIVGQPYSLQHRKRRSQGGGNSPSNLIVVLGTGTTGHHERIDSRRDPHDEAKGYTVRSWGDPALIPVMVFSEHGSWATVWLTDDGRYSTEPPGEVA